MIYQTLITACWKPHLLSWCMVMIASRHRLPWILTKALFVLPSSVYIYLLCAVVLSLAPLLHFLFGTTLPFSSDSLHPRLLFPLLSFSINALFNPPWYWEVGYLLFRLIPPVCPVLKWKALMLLPWANTGAQPGTKYHCHGFLSTWYRHQPQHKSDPRPLGEGGKSLYYPENRRFTPAADHQITPI